MTRLIVFGVSGVGKTTACRRFSLAHPDYRHLIASELIRKVSGKSLNELQHSSRAQILSNQALLALAFEDEVRKPNVEKVILDGQCVIDTGSDTVLIPNEAVASLRPDGFMLLEADPETVIERRASSPRGRPVRNAQQIADQLLLNRRAVEGYSKVLQVPHLVVNANRDYVDLTPFVSELVSL